MATPKKEGSSSKIKITPHKKPPPSELDPKKKIPDA